MHLIRFLSCALAGLMLLLVLSSLSLAEDDSVFVNVMIDVNSFPKATLEQMNITHKSLINLTNVMDSKRLNFTYFISGDAVPVERLYLTYLGESPRHELAMGGTTPGETLAGMSSSRQKENLDKMKKSVKACHVCGGKTIDPTGFRPQSFSQNEDTFKSLESAGIVYSAGFQEGILYAPGHENDAWPYRLEGHNLYAVPVSSAELSGERVYLSDRYLKEEKKISGREWYDLLSGKFDQCLQKGVPLVVVFDNLVSGQDGDYLDACKKFINYAVSKNATFVTTMDLVNLSMARDQVEITPGTTADEAPAGGSKCVLCDSLKNVTIEETENTTNSTEAKPMAMPKAVMSE